MTARTYGELARLVADLPAEGSAVSPATPPQAKDVARIDSRSGHVQRVDRWVVPQRMEVKVTSGHVMLDFTQAVITQPTLKLDVDVRSGHIRLMTKPGIVVDADDVAIRSGHVRVRAPWGSEVPVQLRSRSPARSAAATSWPGRGPDVLAVADQAAQAVRDRRALTLDADRGVRRARHRQVDDRRRARRPTCGCRWCRSTPSRRRWRTSSGWAMKTGPTRLGDAAAELVFRLAAAVPRRDRRRLVARSAPGVGRWASSPGALEVFCHCDPPELAADRAHGPDRPQPSPHSPRRDQPGHGATGPRAGGGRVDAAARWARP